MDGNGRVEAPSRIGLPAELTCAQRRESESFGEHRRGPQGGDARERSGIYPKFSVITTYCGKAFETISNKYYRLVAIV